MNAIRITKQLESDTLHLPELRPFVGRTVEIIVLEKTVTTSGTGNWPALEQLAHHLENYDFDAWREQREFDLQHVQDHLP